MMNENEMYEEINSQQEITAINYNELLKKIDSLFKTISSKINIGKQNSQNNTEDGIFKDLEDSFIELENAHYAFITYFKNPPNDEEKELIHKMASLKKTMEDFAKFANGINQISLDDKLQNYNTQIEKFCEIVEYKLSNNSNNYSLFLDNFIKNEKKKLNIFAEIFTKMTKHTKLFLISLSFISTILGVGLGILIVLTYLKYLEYEKLTQRVNTITQGLAIISVDKNDKNLTLSFAKNKKTIFNENKNSIQITLQGGE
ncbi:hypothetical protein I9077_00835 [Campylobacter jejuni]|nr:hypothetical protein [Campylobacter jejuni]EAL0578668.1 hypothetical protein [Campylobacter jejuni]ECL7558181.1 hypothetical protein [Campylobacter jejuni]ECP6302864.1 hypothetical protein [Campylobacter jejuni]ECQ1434333.1 hypothetical protein [Campylobacter jejuni]